MDNFLNEDWGNCYVWIRDFVEWFDKLMEFFEELIVLLLMVVG